MSPVVMAEVTRASAGYWTLTGPLTMLTVFPCAMAAVASAAAMRPLEAFVRNRTSSM